VNKSEEVDIIVVDEKNTFYIERYLLGKRNSDERSLLIELREEG
jgi:hypothetical protein